MARGKHARAKVGRDRRRVEEQVTQTRLAIARERELLAMAHEKGALADRLRAEARDVQASNQRALAGYVQRLQEELRVASEQAAVAARAKKAAQRAWDKITDAYIDANGSGRETIEDLMDAIGGGGFLVDDELRERKGMTTERALRLQSIRGMRSTADAQRRIDKFSDVSEAAAFAGMLRPMLEDPRLAKRAGAAMKSSPWSRTRDAVAAWWPSPLLEWALDEPFGWLPDSMGVLRGDDALLSDVKDQIAYEDVLAHEPEMWAQDVAILKAADRMMTPWSALPRFSRPGDSLLLRAHYTASSYGLFLRSVEHPAPQDADPADERTWVRPATRVDGELAWTVKTVAAAVPFWLPPGQSQAFADSDPIKAVDLPDLRVPFDATMVTLSTPLRIEPVAAASEKAHRAARITANAMRQAALSRDALTWESVWMKGHWEQSADDMSRDFACDVAAMMSSYGAWVEAVVVTSEERGRLGDRFVWCVAIGTADPRIVSARVAVPARLSACSPEIASTVTNLAAAAAWGDWHEPDQRESPRRPHDPGQWKEMPGFDDAEKRGTFGQVRVLNVGRTSGGGQTPGDGPPRQVTPHMRRGHWRRQRHGAGRSLTKMVRVAPTVVGATRAVDIAPRVYTLPTVAAEEQNASPNGTSAPSRDDS